MTSFNFKQLKLWLALSATLIFTGLTAQTAAVVYYTGFDNTAQLAGWTVFRKSTPTTYSWVVDNSASYAGGSCARHDYPVSASAPTQDWYVSPAFNFAAGGKIDSIRYSFSGFSTPLAGDTVGIYLLTGSSNPTVASSIVKLFDFRGAEYNNDGAWRKKTDIAIPNKSGQSYLALKYNTTNSWLDVKFDNLAVKANATATTALVERESSSEAIRAFPNPAKKTLAFDIRDRRAEGESFHLRVFNFLGEVIVSRAIEAGVPFEHGLADGLYLYELSGNNLKTIKTGRIFVKSD